MKILLAADVHIEHSSGGSESILLDVLETTINKEKPDVLFILGDLFDEFGEIKSHLGASVKDSIVRIATSGCRVVIVAGNHDYQRVEPEFFGKSIVYNLFSELEHIGIYVCDKEARFIDIDGHTILGIPYRETWEQFEISCLKPIEDYLENNDPKTVTVGWHCGLPFGEKWSVMAGDERENGWIREGHPAVELLMELATDKTVYLGHYHTPTGLVPCGGGSFQYVGSPATRSRSESEEVKRFILLDTENNTSKEIETGLSIDHIAGSVEEASAYSDKMVERFGERIKAVLNISVILPAGASMSDYSGAVSSSRHLPHVRIDRPTVKPSSKQRQIEDRISADGGTLDRSKLEEEILRLAFIDFYRGKDFKGVSVEEFLSLGKMSPDFFTELTAASPEQIEESLKKSGLKKLIGKLESQHFKILADYSSHYKELEDIIESSRFS